MKMTGPESDGGENGALAMLLTGRILITSVCLALVLGIAPGCSLLMVPIKILTSLISDAISMAPKAAGLLMVVRDPDLEREEGEQPDFSLPLRNLDREDRVLLAEVERLFREGAPEMSASSLLQQLLVASEQNRIPDRIDFFRVTPESVPMISRLARAEGNSILYSVRVLPGRKGRDARVDLVARLQQRGTIIVDWTPGTSKGRLPPSALAFPGRPDRNLASP